MLSSNIRPVGRIHKTGNAEENNILMVIERLKKSKKGNNDQSIHQISEETIRETQNALRVLNVRQPPGTLGKVDGPLKRICALLEYTIRQEQGLKIPMEVLASAVNMKVKAFVQFHHMIGNVRSKSLIISSDTKKGDNSNQQANRQTSFASSSSKATSASSASPSSLPMLAIKLGACVPDANGIADRAQQLLNQLRTPPHLPAKTTARSARAAHSSALKDHQMLLQDIESNKPAYEAVCFFLVARRESQYRSRKISTKQRKDDGGAEHLGPDQSQQQQQEHSQLTVETILKYTTDFTGKDFQAIHAYVSKEMEKRKLTTNQNHHQVSWQKNAASTATTNPSGKRSAGKQQFATSTGQGKRQKISPASDNHETKKRKTTSRQRKMDSFSSQNDGSNDGFFGLSDNPTIGDSYSLEFQCWKDKVIAETTRLAKINYYSAARTTTITLTVNSTPKESLTDIVDTAVCNTSNLTATTTSETSDNICSSSNNNSNSNKIDNGSSNENSITISFSNTETTIFTDSTTTNQNEAIQSNTCNEREAKKEQQKAKHYNESIHQAAQYILQSHGLIGFSNENL